MKTGGMFKYWLSLLLACAVTSSCGKTGSKVSTETNWLSPCVTSAECGQLDCVCGLCSQACQALDDCTRAPEAVRCAPPDNPSQCSGTTTAICLPEANLISAGGLGGAATDSRNTTTSGGSSQASSNTTASGGSAGSGGDTATSTTSSSNAGGSNTSGGGAAMAENCRTLVGNQGSEGELCDLTLLCESGENFGVNCTRSVLYDFSCTCGDTEETFVTRDARCEALADVDFIDERCGYALGGDDGVYDPIVVTDTTEEPAFEAAPIDQGSCAEPTPNTDGSTCTWESDCDGVSVVLDCYNPQVSSPGCRCLIDGQYYRGAFVEPLDCETMTVADAFAACEFPE